jgi:hypothetical protein
LQGARRSRCHGRLAGGALAKGSLFQAAARPQRLSPAHASAARRITRPARQINAAVDAPMLQGLIDGSYKLPRSEELVPTPTPVRGSGAARAHAVGARHGAALLAPCGCLRPHTARPRLQVPCPGGCEERFCSAACAQAAWEGYHCLLCPVGASGDAKGKGKAPAAADKPRSAAGKVGGGSRGAGGSSSGGKGKAAARAAPEEVVHGVRLRRGRLGAFLEHADESNDMLRLAAQVGKESRG